VRTRDALSLAAHSWWIGQVAGFFSIIPFYNWKRVHGRHHKWTGWQDVDPTTATLVPRELSRAERVLVNVCWRFWIPLFSVLYRINNFWNWRDSARCSRSLKTAVGWR
jgi:fatty acid desaturase